MKWFRGREEYIAIHEDLFAIRNNSDGYYLIYAPVRRVLFETNYEGVCQIQAVLAGDGNNRNTEMKNLLQKEGLLVNPIYPTADLDRSFAPEMLILSITSACNLRCIYCYARGGEEPQHMSWEIMTAAVDYTIENLKNTDRSHLVLTFHGGGEPLMLWNRLKGITEYTEEATRAHSLKLTVSMVTNGTLINKIRADWISKHVSRVTVSMDGSRAVQEYQRPQFGGGSSYDAVVGGMSLLRNNGVSFSIRATITGLNVRDIAEMIRFAHQMGATGLHPEPYERVGRAKTEDIPVVTTSVFVEEYIKAAAVAEELGIDLHYSGDKHHVIRSVFCGANGEIFCVLPDGQVSACTRVTRPTDETAEVFLYGKFDNYSRKFIIDHDRFLNLRRLGVEQLSQCQNCFCKWHCAGHCPNSRLIYGDEECKSFTCPIVREITKFRLSQVLNRLSG